MHAARDAVATGTVRVRVWDLPTRLFHWLLAGTVVGSVISAQIGGNAVVWHFRFGYTVFALLAFRIAWGLVGGRWSRFVHFAYGPGSVRAYLRGEQGPSGRFDVGHSPLGALSVFALLALLAAQVATGLVADDEIANTGPLNRYVSGAVASGATTWHKTVGQWGLYALVALHVGAIAWYAYAKRRNLVGPMLTGDKALPAGTPASADRAATRLLAAVLAAACAGAVAWVVSLGG